MSHTYLITGVSGSGKSTLKELLRKRGYQAIDIDDGYADWRKVDTHEVVSYDPQGGEAWLETVDWLLRVDALTNRINRSRDKTLFVVGSAGDLREHLDLFNVVFLLQYSSIEQIKYRIASRTNNPFGKNPGEIENIRSYFKSYQDEMITGGAIAIDCMLPTEQIIKYIEQTIREN